MFFLKVILDFPNFNQKKKATVIKFFRLFAFNKYRAPFSQKSQDILPFIFCPMFSRFESPWILNFIYKPNGKVEQFIDFFLSTSFRLINTQLLDTNVLIVLADPKTCKYLSSPCQKFGLMDYKVDIVRVCRDTPTLFDQVLNLSILQK